MARLSISFPDAVNIADSSEKCGRMLGVGGICRSNWHFYYKTFSHWSAIALKLDLLVCYHFTCTCKTKCMLAATTSLLETHMHQGAKFGYGFLLPIHMVANDDAM